MASAKPWAMKNCADSAPHAINMEANRREGAVHSTAAGPTARMGSAPSSSSARKQAAELFSENAGARLW
jgi:hypothetical protein